MTTDHARPLQPKPYALPTWEARLAERRRSAESHPYVNIVTPNNSQSKGWAVVFIDPTTGKRVERKAAEASDPEGREYAHMLAEEIYGRYGRLLRSPHEKPPATRLRPKPQPPKADTTPVRLAPPPPESRRLMDLGNLTREELYALRDRVVAELDRRSSP